MVINKTVKYADVIKRNFYLDADGNLRRKLDGYLGRFKAHDLVIPFKCRNGYSRIQAPEGIRKIFQFHTVVAILAGLPLTSTSEIDHIDGNRDNNHPSNLRVVTRKINNRNRRKRSDNTSGITGIRWDEKKQRYIIRRTTNNKRISTSRKTLEEAKIVLNQMTLLDGNYTENHGK